MTGIIICDACGLKMFAHGRVTDETKDLPKFDGWRKPMPKKIGDVTLVEFQDFCSDCAKKDEGCKR